MRFFTEQRAESRDAVIGGARCGFDRNPLDGEFADLRPGGLGSAMRAAVARSVWSGSAKRCKPTTM
jgi:hypothetical protein